MKALFFVTLLTLSNQAQAVFNLVCYNASIQIEISSVSDTDGNLAFFLRDVEPVASETAWIAVDPQVDSHWFSAVFSAPGAELNAGAEGPSQLFILEGTEAMLARDGQVHYLHCYENY